MTTETVEIGFVPAIIGGAETIVYSYSCDPGDGNNIMVYIDATPLDDARRAKLATSIVRACRSHDKLVAALERLVGDYICPVGDDDCAYCAARNTIAEAQGD